MLKKTSRKSPWPLRILLIGVALVAIVLFLWIRSPGATTQGVVRMNASPNQHIEPIGDGILYYDGTMLSRIGANGMQQWHFQAGPMAGYHSSSKHVVVWSGTRLTILNPNNGNPVYENEMKNPIQFARAGDTFVAVFSGEQDKGTVDILDSAGTQVDHVDISNATLLDVGFYLDSKEKLWLMDLDTTGTVPQVSLQNTVPNDVASGKNALGEQLAYRVYFNAGKLRVVDTRQIRTFDSRIKEDAETPPVRIYGWYLQDQRVVNRVQYELLIPMPRVESDQMFSDVRLIHPGVDRVLHLPASCVGVVLGSKAIYAFSGTNVYACPYGEYAFSVTSIRVQVSKVIGITQNDQAIVSDGGDVYLVALPK